MAKKTKRRAAIRVGTMVKFVDGDVPEIQPGGVDFGVPLKVLSINSGYAEYPYTVKGNGMVSWWLAKREWLRVVPRKKRKAAK